MENVPLIVSDIIVILVDLQCGTKPCILITMEKYLSLMISESTVECSNFRIFINVFLQHSEYVGHRFERVDFSIWKMESCRQSKLTNIRSNINNGGKIRLITLYSRVDLVARH